MAAAGRIVTRTGALALALCACRAGRDYEPPDLSARTAPAWRAAGEGERPEDSQRAELAHWWRRLGSAELDALAQRLLGANLSLGEARQRVLAAQARRALVGAQRSPRVESQAGYARAGTGDQSLNFAGPPPGSEADVWSLGLAASWELDLWGRVARLAEAADAEIAVALEDYRGASVALLAELALAFVDAHALHERRALLARSLAVAEDTLRLARARLEAGNGTRLELEQATRELEDLRARAPELERALRQAENRIAVLVGERPRDGLVDARAPLASPEPLGLGLPAELLEHRADVRAAERRLAAAVARVGAAEGERYPRVTLAGTLALRAREPATLLEGADALSYSIGPSLTIPLLEGGRIEAGVRLGEAQAEEARLALERALLEATAEVEDAAQAARSARARVASLERAARAADAAVELARSLYEAGTRGLLELLDAQRAQLALAERLALAVQAAHASTVGLYRALGGGWESLALEDGIAAAPAAGETR